MKQEQREKGNGVQLLQAADNFVPVLLVATTRVTHDACTLEMILNRYIQINSAGIQVDNDSAIAAGRRTPNESERCVHTVEEAQRNWKYCSSTRFVQFI